MEYQWYHAADFTPEELRYYATNDHAALTPEESAAMDYDREESIWARASCTFHLKAEKSPRESFASDAEYRLYLSSLQSYARYAALGIDTE